MCVKLVTHGKTKIEMGKTPPHLVPPGDMRGFLKLEVAISN